MSSVRENPTGLNIGLQLAAEALRGWRPAMRRLLPVEQFPRLPPHRNYEVSLLGYRFDEDEWVDAVL